MTVVDSARSAYRRRQLAGDRRAGIWARRKARTKQQTYVREHWRWMLITGLIAMAVVALAATLAPSSFEKGFLLGGGLASIGGAFAAWVMQTTGTAPTMMGDLAEQWTARELRKLHRQGWRVVNHLCLRGFDIDHVLIGPGGVFAIETKWSATPWSADAAGSRIRDGCRRAEGNARDLRLWSQFNNAIAPTEIGSVLVLWGTGTSKTEPTLTCIGRTTVIAGSGMERWRESLTSGVLTQGQVDSAWRTLEKQAAVRDLKENGNDPLPISIYEGTVWVAALLATGAFGCLAALQLLSLSSSFVVGIPACLLLALLAVPGRRWKRGKYLSLAWQTGVGFAIVAASAYAFVH